MTKQRSHSLLVILSGTLSIEEEEVRRDGRSHALSSTPKPESRYAKVFLQVLISQALMVIPAKSKRFTETIAIMHAFFGQGIGLENLRHQLFLQRSRRRSMMIYAPVYS